MFSLGYLILDAETSLDPHNLPESVQEKSLDPRPLPTQEESSEEAVHEGNSHPSMLEARALVDWSLCAICQTETEEKLVNPTQSTFAKAGVQTGYGRVVDNILKLEALGDSSVFVLNKDLLEQCNDMKTTFEEKKAVWHRTCRNKFDNQKVARAEKRYLKEEDNDQKELHSPVKTRRTIGPVCDRDAEKMVLLKNL